MKIINSSLVPGVILLALIALLSLRFYSVRSNIEFLRKNGNVAEGKFLSVVGKNGQWFYNSGTRNHIRKHSVHQGIKTGEKYLVYFEADNPKNAFISLYEPIIDTINYSTTCSDYVKYFGTEGVCMIKYSYRAKDHKIVRYQEVLIPKTLRESDSFEILYNNENESIGYINFNKKCKH